MSESKPRLSRLSAILTQLQAKRLVTARELAKKHEVSIRTIYRDIRTLEQSGIPIVTEEGRGYSIVEGYTLPPVMFTEEEANALITVEQLILTNKDQSLSDHYQSAITKIKSILRNNQKTKTEFIANRIQVRGNSIQKQTSNYLIQLQSTIADFRVVKIDYLSLKNERSQRQIEPFALYTSVNNNWLLIAYCRKRNDFRAFRLDCIQSLQMTDDHFEPHKMTLEQYFEECRKKWQHTPDIPLSQADHTFASHQKNNNMQHVNIEPFNMIGIAIQTTNANGQAGRDIPELWNKFRKDDLFNQIPNKIDYSVFSLYTDYEGDHTQPYTTVIGCKVDNLDDIPEGMIGKSFEGGKYVQITAKGDLMKGLIIEHWNKIWAMDLGRVYSADFEVYGEKAQNINDAEVDIFVAVK